MANTAKDDVFNERRARTRKEIKQLITERNSVLAQYYSLVSCINEEECAEIDNESIIDLLQEFCQELVDYLATGHFEIYRRIEEGDERRTEMLKLADSVFNQLSQTTEVAIDFNDAYDLKTDGLKNDIEIDALNNLPSQLSKLGQNLATRIDLEDQFINSLLMHAEKPALHVV